MPFNKGLNRSVVGAFSLPSPQNPSGLWALWQRVGAWTGVLFQFFVEEDVLPHLPQGSVLVLDNARIHHGQALKEAVEQAGHSLLYLPPCSICRLALSAALLYLPPCSICRLTLSAALLYLPPYSPDFNPIELVWSWLKSHVRHLAPRTDEQRAKDIRLVQTLLPPQAAKKWFLKCGLH